jgi:hypothetical protein
MHIRVAGILYWLAWVLPASASDSNWIDYPSNGFATMTHYGLPLGDVAACGCTPSSTFYPTAAMNQMAYGNTQSCSLKLSRSYIHIKYR